MADRAGVCGPWPWAVLMGLFEASPVAVRSVRPITGHGLGACAPVSRGAAAWLDKGLNRDAVAADKALCVTEFRTTANIHYARLPLSEER